jgi:hypothetical protein
VLQRSLAAEGEAVTELVFKRRFRFRFSKLGWWLLAAGFCLWLLAAAAVPVLLCLKLVGVL